MKIDSQLFTSGEGAKFAASANADPTSRSSLLPVQPTRTEYLPVRVAIAEDERTLQAAIALRHAAYARHAPAIAAALTRPEQADLLGEAPVFVVQSKLDASVVGTMRVHFNDHGSIPIQQSFELPARLAGQKIAEAVRFASDPSSSGRLATQLLFKAFYFLCLARRIDYMVIGARVPVDRLYERLGFVDICGAREYINLKHASNLPHRILIARVSEFEESWRCSKHPLYGFVFEAKHAEVDWLLEAP